MVLGWYQIVGVKCVKSVQIRSFFWFVFSCIRTEYRKIQTRKNSVFGHFLRSSWHNLFIFSVLKSTQFYMYKFSPVINNFKLAII